MTRALAFLVHNWPLKVAAIVMATLLYGIFVLTQNTKALEDIRVPIREDARPEGVVLLSPLGDVTQIRYFVDDPSVRVTSSTFTASADLARVDPNAPSNLVSIDVESIDPRVDVVDFQPSQVLVEVEAIERRTVEVRVVREDDPEGFDIRDAVVTPDEVIVEGPESLVRLVDAAVARIQLDPAGLDFDRDVELIPVDTLGEQLRPVDVEPSSAHVRIAVFTNGQQRSVSVRPNVIGTPAPGFEIATVSVDPLVVQVEGDADQITNLPRVDTEPISVNGATESFERTALLVYPAGVLPAGVDQVRVTITLRAVTSTRAFDAAVALAGPRADRLYDLSVDRVQIIVGGSTAALNQMDGAAFQVSADVAGLEPGTHVVPVVADLPAGLALVSANPATVTVTVTVPESSSPPPSAVP
jgi:YbbR domain-containing protein